MSLQFHNQLSKHIDEFAPLQEGKVSLYTCGPTVYSTPTVGNWASYIYWDTLVRLLNASGLEVNRVMNITDVGHLVSDGDEGEDKLEKGARLEGKTAWEVAEYYTDEFLQGMKELNLVTPTHLPKATDYIPQQLELVRRLKQKGFTYQITDGIYFDTSKFPTYGDFAGLHLDEQRAGARIEYNPEKRNASDFALWKFTPAGETRDMQWETPQDLTDDDTNPQGFPGWHLECSTMAMDLLGNTIDIHTGGIDHIPVHHTNEIAQSESANGVKFANYWLHNNHLKVDGTKISKSLGNGYTLADLQEKGYSPLDFRMLILQGHYRTEGNFTFENLTAARNRRLNWRNVAALRHQIHDTLEPAAHIEENSPAGSLYATSGALLETLSDDLNTVAVLAQIDQAFDIVELTGLQELHHHALISLLETIDSLLGLELLSTTPDITDEQKQRIIERTRAREENNFNRSDEIRSQLEKDGITIRDTASGPIWEYTR